jgi:hypothetical protein
MIWQMVWLLPSAMHLISLDKGILLLVPGKPKSRSVKQDQQENGERLVTKERGSAPEIQ